MLWESYRSPKLWFIVDSGDGSRGDSGCRWPEGREGVGFGNVRWRGALWCKTLVATVCPNISEGHMNMVIFLR